VNVNNYKAIYWSSLDLRFTEVVHVH